MANMAPTWVPKWNQDDPKTDPKIDQNFDGFRDRFLMEFWWILGAKLGLEIEQKSIPEGMKTCKRTREQNTAYWRRLKPSGARLWPE